MPRQAKTTDDLTEKVASLQHENWSSWMRFMFSCCERRADGSLVIPLAKVEQWQSMMRRSYAQLTEVEKANSREQAAQILAIGQTEVTDVNSAG